jgi:hypothetical protein
VNDGARLHNIGRRRLALTWLWRRSSVRNVPAGERIRQIIGTSTMRVLSEAPQRARSSCNRGVAVCRRAIGEGRFCVLKVED